LLETLQLSQDNTYIPHESLGRIKNGDKLLEQYNEALLAGRYRSALMVLEDFINRYKKALKRS